MTRDTLHIRNFNNDFLLINAATNDASLATLGRHIYAQQFDFIEEVIITETEICIKLNHRFNDDQLRLLQQLEREEVVESKIYQLPVFFSEHEDWKAVISTTGFSKQEIIDQLTATHFSLAMFGFLPGFLYLSGLNPKFHVPRKSVPAKYVKAHSVAIGGSYLGVYALDSPGGWHVIGQTPIAVLQLSQLPPVLLNPGDQVQICAISQSEFSDIANKRMSIIDYNA